MKNDFSKKCISIIRKHIPEGCVEQSELEFVKRKDGSDYTDIDFYFYKDILFPEHVYRIIFVFEFAKLSEDWVNLRPYRKIKGSPYGIIAGSSDRKLTFVSSKNVYMPFDSEDFYTECKIHKKDFKTGKFTQRGNYVNDDIRKVAASALKLLFDANNKFILLNRSFIVFPFVVTEQKIKERIPVFKYYLEKEIKKLPFLDNVSLKYLEPIQIQILNENEIDHILPVFTYIFKSIEAFHPVGYEVMRMALDPFVEEMKKDDIEREKKL